MAAGRRLRTVHIIMAPMAVRITAGSADLTTTTVPIVITNSHTTGFDLTYGMKIDRTET